MSSLAVSISIPVDHSNQLGSKILLYQWIKLAVTINLRVGHIVHLGSEILIYQWIIVFGFSVNISIQVNPNVQLDDEL